MDRLFALLTHGFGVSEKQAQLACFIINNIAQLGETALLTFKKYERVLTLVSFNNENLSSITSGILFSLSGRDDLEGSNIENIAITNMRMKLRTERDDSNISSPSSDYEED